MRAMRLSSVGLALALSSMPLLVDASGPDSASAKEVMAKVHEAAKYLHDKGQAGFPDFNRNARWVWKDSYVFVYSCTDDKMIAHPLRPDLVGKPILQMEDDKGNLLFQRLCEASSKPHGGWVEYWWPKPGEAKASRKISYTESTEVSFQRDVRVGAGIYEPDMTVEQLNELAQEAAEPTRYAP